jgi:hypothetical protein
VGAKGETKINVALAIYVIKKGPLCPFKIQGVHPDMFKRTNWGVHSARNDFFGSLKEFLTFF